jgi:hypothetical protein
MGRTTPPPPLDVTGVFPELAPLARQAVRLHPRAGAPGRGDSSLGGPLLWPADAPWPTCRGLRLVDRRQPIAPAELQRFRAILDAADRRWRPSEGQALEFTEEEAAEVDRIAAGAIEIDLTAGERVYPEPQPHRDQVALVPVLQLYARDVPGLPFPGHADLFQLLWCPNHHGLPWRGPCPVTVWRRTADVAEPLAAPPASRFEDDRFARDYLPLPCVLHPERVVEYPHPCGVPAAYPHPCNLPAELAERIERWGERHDELYWAALSTAPGTKVGGHPRWIQPPAWPLCGCGRRMEHLLTIASDEFGPQGRWLPLEDREDPRVTSRRRSIVARASWAPHGLMLGDVGSLYLFTCTACANRPLAGTTQFT